MNRPARRTLSDSTGKKDRATCEEGNSWRAIAEANRADMLSRGIWGVPSFRVNEMPVLWGQDRLWMLEEDLIAALGVTQP